MKNVIYIISDQMRWDALGCNGAEFIKTPAFDGLAASGANFTCACSGNPVCVPARGILATGCYSHNCMDPSANNQNGGQILPEHIHIAKHFRDNNYSTYGFGKFHHMPYKTNPGFDVFEIAEEGRIERDRSLGKLPTDMKEDYELYLEKQGYAGMARAHGIGNNDPRGGKAPMPIEHYVDTWSTTRAIETLTGHVRNNKDRKFFLQLGFVKPHAPYDPPAPYDSMYDPRDIPQPWGTAEDLSDRNPLMQLERENYLIPRQSKMSIQYSRAHYFGLVSYLDAQLQRILDFLQANKLSQETLIVFTADHGDYIGDHGMFFKRYFGEGSVRIPLIISLPGQVEAATLCDSPVGQEDIVPTICELTGVAVPSAIDGRSLVPLIKNPNSTHKDWVVSQYDIGSALTIMIRNKRFKYCFAAFESTEELYDLKNDPHELKNLAGQKDFKNKLIEMRNAANQWCIDNKHQELIQPDSELLHTKFESEKYRRHPADKMGISRW